MNKQKFIEFLRNPGELKEQHLAELDDLVTEYPYFQAARALEAKGNRLLRTRIAGKKTASAAVCSTNRVLLKKYLKGDGYVDKSAIAAKRAEVRPTSPSVSQTRIEIKQETKSTEIISSPGSSSIDQLIYDLKEDMRELEKSRAKYIEVTRKIEEEEAVENAVKRATDGTTSGKSAGGTKRSTSSASKSSGSSRTSTAKKSTASKKPGAAKKTTTKKAGTTRSASKTTGSKVKSTTAKKPSTTRKTTPKKTTTRSATKSEPQKSSSRTSRSSKTTATRSSKKKEDSDGEQQQRELIDQFIKSNPSFKPASEPKNVEDLSAESTDLPEDIGSEYLAEIFLGQGKKDHAIKIYNSLILRFPEKRAYFAGRIKKIK